VCGVAQALALNAKTTQAIRILRLNLIVMAFLAGDNSLSARFLQGSIKGDLSQGMNWRL